MINGICSTFPIGSLKLPVELKTKLKFFWRKKTKAYFAKLQVGSGIPNSRRWSSKLAYCERNDVLGHTALLRARLVLLRSEDLRSRSARGCSGSLRKSSLKRIWIKAAEKLLKKMTHEVWRISILMDPGPVAWCCSMNALNRVSELRPASLTGRDVDSADARCCSMKALARATQLRPSPLPCATQLRPSPLQVDGPRRRFRWALLSCNYLEKQNCWNGNHFCTRKGAHHEMGATTSCWRMRKVVCCLMPSRQENLVFK